MKSRVIVFRGVGLAEIEEREVAAPQPWEILVQTQVNGICAFELHAFSGELPVDWFPTVMGHEAVGVVADVGKDVKQFKVGDKVSTLGFETYRDFYPVWEGHAALIPQDEKDPRLWLGEPPACVVNAVRLIEQRRHGPKLTVIGCGFMGLLLVQLAVKRGFHVTAMDTNPERAALARRYGATSDELAPESQDVVVECSGNPATLTLADNLVRQGGMICLFAHHLPHRVCNTNLWHMKGLDILNATPAASTDWTRDFQEAVQHIRDGVFDLKPLVTHLFDAARPQETLEMLVRSRPADYIKGVFRFS